MKIYRSSRKLARCFSSSSSQTGNIGDDQKMDKKGEDIPTDKKSILHIDNAVKHCSAQIKKFDFYAFVAG